MKLNVSEMSLEELKNKKKKMIGFDYENPESCMEAVKQNGYAVKYVHTQTQELCMEAIKQNGYVLRYVRNQTQELCMEAVKQNGCALQYVHNQTPEICMEAVKQNGYALQYIHNQTQELCMEAVKQNGCALRYVINQTPEICLAALRYNGDDENRLLIIRDLSILKSHPNDNVKETPDANANIEEYKSVFISAKEARERTDKNVGIINDISTIYGLITKAIQESKYSIELRNCILQNETIEFLENQGYSVTRLHPSYNFYDYKISWEYAH